MEEARATVLLIAVQLIIFTKSNGEFFNKTKIKVLEFTYPPGSTDMPIAKWETQANLTKDNLPNSINMCTSVYVKSMVADWNSHINLFKIEDPDKDFEQWLVLRMLPDTDVTSFEITIGRKDEEVKVSCKGNMPIFFPKFWTRVCMSIDLEIGFIRVVVNGRILENQTHTDIKALRRGKPSRFTIRLGDAMEDNGINSKWTDMNMFLNPLDEKRMVAITTSGSKECGRPGDFLDWEDTQWTLKGRKGKKEWGSGDWKDYILMIDSAKLTDNAFEDGPCWRQSQIVVYQFWDIHQHSTCMRHCAKISGGRSPSVVTEVQWKELTSNIEAIGPMTSELFSSHLWLSAVKGDEDSKHFNFVYIKTLRKSKVLAFTYPRSRYP